MRNEALINLLDQVVSDDVVKVSLNVIRFFS